MLRINWGFWVYPDTALPPISLRPTQKGKSFKIFQYFYSKNPRVRLQAFVLSTLFGPETPPPLVALTLMIPGALISVVAACLEAAVAPKS
jgi:hypothetical protein